SAGSSAISSGSARPAAGSSSVWRAIAQACSTVARKLSSRRSPVLALPLRLPKYTVTPMPRSRVDSSVSTSPMRTSTFSPCSSLQLTSAWLAPCPLHMASSRSATSARRSRRATLSGSGLSMDYPCEMRGRDDETGEFHAPSRSEQRRAALDVLALGETLAGLPPARLAKLPVPESLLPHIEDARRITSHVARKRQLGFLAKQMRREDEAVLEAIRDALEAGGESARKETALLPRVEAA